MSVQALAVSEEARGGFYPTPPALAERLLSGIDWGTVENVLEPQAGKGNIVRAAAETYAALRGYGDRHLRVDCVEIDPWLRSILQYEFCGPRMNELSERLRQLDEKKQYDCKLQRYRELSPDEAAEYKELKREQELFRRLELFIVHDDFHTFQSRKHYDLIAMNPPFADGDAHLLKAIALQCRNGGMIRCILNAETIRNPYTNRRRFLVRKLTELEAEIEYVEGAFSDSERKTDVEAALIRINIPKPKRESVIFDRLRRAARVEEPTPSDVTEMTVDDFISQIVSQFNVEVDAGIALIREYGAMKPYILESFHKDGFFNSPTMTLCVGEPGRSSRGEVPSVNKYLRLVRAKYWEALFSNKEFVGKLTSNLRDAYRKKVSAMADYDFTLFNIQQIAEQMNAEMGKGIQETIVALFDKLTQEHAWYPECAKNIHYYNGWKTNKVHKINSKVIIPTCGMFSSYEWSRNTFEVREAEKVISDIEKVFDYLDGNETAAVDLHGVLLRACEAGQTRNIPCKYFDVTLYKKGTMHIRFRDQTLVDRFNIYCCRKKNWLPPNYGRTVYEDMSAGERAVVDGFHGDGSEGAGKAAYQEVVARRDYYLTDPVKGMPALLPPGGGAAMGPLEVADPPERRRV